MAKYIVHRLLVKLDELHVHPDLPVAEHACSHVHKRLGTLRTRKSKLKPGRQGFFTHERLQFTPPITAGRFENALLCKSCWRKSQAHKKWYGTDKNLFIVYEKSGPGPLNPPSVPPGFVRAKAAGSR